MSLRPLVFAILLLGACAEDASRKKYGAKGSGGSGGSADDGVRSEYRIVAARKSDDPNSGERVATKGGTATESETKTARRDEAESLDKAPPVPVAKPKDAVKPETFSGEVTGGTPLTKTIEVPFAKAFQVGIRHGDLTTSAPCQLAVLRSLHYTYSYEDLKGELKPYDVIDGEAVKVADEDSPLVVEGSTGSLKIAITVEAPPGTTCNVKGTFEFFFR